MGWPKEQRDGIVAFLGRLDLEASSAPHLLCQPDTQNVQRGLRTYELPSDEDLALQGCLDERDHALTHQSGAAVRDGNVTSRTRPTVQQAANALVRPSANSMARTIVKVSAIRFDLYGLRLACQVVASASACLFASHTCANHLSPVRVHNCHVAVVDMDSLPYVPRSRFVRDVESFRRLAKQGKQDLFACLRVLILPTAWLRADHDSKRRLDSVTCDLERQRPLQCLQLRYVQPRLSARDPGREIRQIEDNISEHRICAHHTPATSSPDGRQHGEPPTHRHPDGAHKVEAQVL
mmetsp:Transcript_158079/g.507123  ORF Transcript_158079/g.507123 Transcript_158079/m.507123 type:complete len:293 (-) Transcript_158079:1547-2425(-)